MKSEQFLDVIRIEGIDDAEDSCDCAQHNERQIDGEYIGQSEQPYHAHLDDEA